MKFDRNSVPTVCLRELPGRKEHYVVASDIKGYTRLDKGCLVNIRGTNHHVNHTAKDIDKLLIYGD